MIAITEAGQQIIDDNVDQAVQIVEYFKTTLGEARYEQLLDLLALLNPNNKT